MTNELDDYWIAIGLKAEQLKRIKEEIRRQRKEKRSGQEKRKENITLKEKKPIVNRPEILSRKSILKTPETKPKTSTLLNQSNE